MTLRAKLLAAQLPLAIALLVVGVTSTRSLTWLGDSPALMLKDNYRSVLAGGRILGALGDLQAQALASASAHPGPAAVAAEAVQRLEAELAIQEGNVTEYDTEPNEAELTKQVRQTWTAYEAARQAFERAPQAERLDAYFRSLDPLGRQLRRSVLQLNAVNREGMARKSERASLRARESVRVVLAVAVAAIGLGLLSSLLLTARLLRPLDQLSRSVRLLGEGELSARARVESRDEIGRLASEFNGMADRLAAYRRAALGELLQAQRSAQLAIDSLPDPVLVLDPEGEVLNGNRAAQPLLEPGGGEAAGKLPAELRAALDPVRQQALAAKQPYVPGGFEETIRHGGAGGDRFFLPRATPLLGDDGSVLGITIVLQEVTRLLRFDELKNDLVATVAHELRTPLTSLRMAIHLTAGEAVGPLTEKQADLMLAAREDCERLQGIVTDLLDLSRLQAGRMALQLTAVDSRHLLERASAALRAAAEVAGVSLACAPPERAPPVRADADRALIVLTNLLANAVRHTPPGGRVEVACHPAARGMVRFEVRDTGVGIAPEHLGRVFEKFYRVPGGRGGGVGLGLHISREIVLAHGGEMGVSSEPRRGSTFWFTLRAASVRPAAAALRA